MPRSDYALGTPYSAADDAAILAMGSRVRDPGQWRRIASRLGRLRAARGRQPVERRFLQLRYGEMLVILSRVL